METFGYCMYQNLSTVNKYYAKVLTFFTNQLKTSKPGRVVTKGKVILPVQVI